MAEISKDTKAPAFAFDKELAEAICDLEIPNRIKFSPDGKRVLYSTSLCNGHRKGKHSLSTIWMASATESGSTRQLTTGLFDDGTPTWHPDGNQFAFLSDRSKQGESSAIWMMRLDGGDAVSITPTDNAQGIETFSFSPDGEIIAYVSSDEKSEEEKEKEEKEETDPQVWGEKWEYARLRLVNVKTKETRTLVGGNRHVEDISWSPDGKTLAFSSVENPNIEEPMLTGTTISSVNVKSGEVRDLCHIKNTSYGLTWAPDGKIYFLSGAIPDKDTGGTAQFPTKILEEQRFTPLILQKKRPNLPELHAVKTIMLILSLLLAGRS